MKNRLKATVFNCVLLTGISFACWNCRHDPDISTAPQIGFNEIKSIISGKCASCHGVNAELFLIDSARIMSLIVPFKPYGSTLFNTVTNTYSENFMPPSPNTPLDKDQRTKLYLWIMQGANPKSISSAVNP